MGVDLNRNFPKGWEKGPVIKVQCKEGSYAIIQYIYQCMGCILVYKVTPAFPLLKGYTDIHVYI